MAASPAHGVDNRPAIVRAASSLNESRHKLTQGVSVCVCGGGGELELVARADGGGECRPVDDGGPAQGVAGASMAAVRWMMESNGIERNRTGEGGGWMAVVVGILSAGRGDRCACF